jgi:hypothetical protein
MHNIFKSFHFILLTNLLDAFTLLEQRYLNLILGDNSTLNRNACDNWTTNQILISNLSAQNEQ